MSNRVIFRCEKCSKVLDVEADKAGQFVDCPRCEARLVVPDLVYHEKRKYERALTVESNLVQPVSALLTESQNPAVYRVMYTEVPPIEFVLKRSTHVPLLDLSEGGMGFLARVDKRSHGIVPRQSCVIEIDFPILIQPIIVQVEVCWIKPVKENTVLQIGAKFDSADRLLKKVLKNLIKYVSLRAEVIDVNKWGAF